MNTERTKGIFSSFYATGWQKNKDVCGSVELILETSFITEALNKFGQFH